MANHGGSFSPDVHCVFVETSLDTRLALLVHNDEGTSDFREKLYKEHKNCFPEVGEFNISALKVKRCGQFFYLPDSMNMISKAFEGIKRNWFMYVDVVRVEKVKLMGVDQNCSNPELLDKNKEIASDTALVVWHPKDLTLEEGLKTKVKKIKKRKMESSDGKRRQKKPAIDLNQSVVATRYVEVETLKESVETGLAMNVDPISETLGIPRVEPMLIENEMGEKSVEDVVSDKIKNDNLGSHPENHLEADGGLTTSPVTEIKKSSTEIVNKITEVVGNVDHVDSTPESFPISKGGNLADARQKENEMDENIVDNMGPTNIQVTDLASTQVQESQMLDQNGKFTDESRTCKHEVAKDDNGKIDTGEAKPVKSTKKKRSKKAKTPAKEETPVASVTQLVEPFINVVDEEESNNGIPNVLDSRQENLGKIRKKSSKKSKKKDSLNIMKTQVNNTAQNETDDIDITSMYRKQVQDMSSTT